MMCVSDALGYEADAYILDEDQERIGCQDRMKALGMVFSNKPNMNLLVEAIRKAFRSRYWILRNLKNNGFTTEELLTVYTTMIRLVAEYGCPVFHSSLTDAQDEELERLQSHALKCIFGTDQSARTLRSSVNIQTLRSRREEICDKFALKMSSNPEFDRWFPRKQTRASTREVGGLSLIHI